MSLSALSLCGPAIAPVAQIAQDIVSMAQVAAEVVNASTFTVPQQNLKGSVNQGGGGSGGSGCGKPSPCGGCKSKTKSCGGGGGGCGGKSSSSCSGKKHTVIFKDFHNKKVKTATVPDGTSSLTNYGPWLSQEDAPTEYIGSQRYVWTTVWQDSSGQQVTSVKSNMEVTARYRTAVDSLNEDTYSSVNQTISDFQSKCRNEINNTVYQSVQLMSDCEEALSGFTGSSSGQETSCMENYRNNGGTIPSNTTSRSTKRSISFAPQKYPGIFNVLEPLAKTSDPENGYCTDWKKFNNLKRRFLNMQSCIVFQVRMLINLDINEVRDLLQESIDKLSNAIIENEDVQAKQEELEQDIFLRLEDIQLDIKNMWEYYKENFNKWLADVRTCFSISLGVDNL